MKRILMIFVLGLVLSGCIHEGTKPSEVDTASINVTISGTIQADKGDGSYVFKQADGKVVEIHDGAVVLQPYVGKSVTLTGQYSGTTLYVDVVAIK